MSDLTPTIVLDTSVVINLLACGDAARLVKALGHRAIVPKQVVEEIVREPVRHEDEGNSLLGLLKSGLLQVYELEGEHYLRFLDLVGAAAPDGLGDGEAATISVAEHLQGVSIIDERKATRIARSRRPPHLTACTLDLYSSSQLASVYSRDELAGLVFNSMKHARMRIPAEWRDWIVELIGMDRAAQCSCFPRSTSAPDTANDARFGDAGNRSTTVGS